MTWKVATAALAFGLLGSSSALAFNPAPPDESGPSEPYAGTFPQAEDFSTNGSFPVVSVNEQEAGCSLWRPETLGEDGRSHPIILWANGTGATPSIMAPTFEHFASHGFVVAVANTTMSGSGEQVLACLDWLTARHDSNLEPYGGRLDLERVGVSGHSQGGGGAIMAGRDPRVTVTAPVQPYVEGLGHDSSSQSQQFGPMFLMTGGLDWVLAPRSQQQQVFDNANVPVFWGTQRYVNHTTGVLSDLGAYRGPTTAWFRYHLMDDNTARGLFYGDDCGLCSDWRWRVERKGIE